MRLSHRTVLAVSGRDAPKYVQGLVTNDVSAVAPGKPAYTMVLNAQGRVLFDAFIYQGGDRGSSTGSIPAGAAAAAAVDLPEPDQESESEPELLIETDAGLAERVEAHLKRYRLRSKVRIDPRPDLEVWCLVNAAAGWGLEKDCNPPGGTGSSGDGGGDGDGDGEGRSGAAHLDPRLAYSLTPTPAVSNLQRLLLPEGTGTGLAPGGLLPEGVQLLDVADYEVLRLRLGLGEGPVDMPPGKALPLESNVDLCNGVSWSKGCYLGQELTARTHHTGVTRKRLVPLRLPANFAGTLDTNEPLRRGEGSKRSAGTIRSQGPGWAIALLRLSNMRAEDLIAKTPTGESVSVTPVQPAWWPEDVVVNVDK